MVDPVEPMPDGSQHIQVLLSAKALQPIADSYGVTNIPTWLLGSQGLVYRRAVDADQVRGQSASFAGCDYLYLLMATE